MKVEKIKGVFGSIIGIVSVVWGIIVMSMSTGRTQSYISYGGDAYTGIQNSAAQTATNVSWLASITKYGLGGILIIAGAMILLCSVCLLLKNRSPITSFDNMKDTLSELADEQLNKQESNDTVEIVQANEDFAEDSSSADERAQTKIKRVVAKTVLIILVILILIGAIYTINSYPYPA